MEAVAARQSERRLAKVKIGGRGFISHQMLGLFFFMLWRVINQVSLHVLFKRYFSCCSALHNEKG